MMIREACERARLCAARLDMRRYNIPEDENKNEEQHVGTDDQVDNADADCRGDLRVSKV